MKQYDADTVWENSVGLKRIVVRVERHRPGLVDDHDLVIFRDEDGHLASIFRGTADRHWTKIGPKWEVGKIYTTQGLRWPLHVVEVDDEGNAYGYWISKYGRPHVNGFRQDAKTRAEYTEVEDG